MSREELLVLIRSHFGKIVGILLGLIISLFIIFLGFIKTLFICLCTFLGYYIGYKFDSGTLNDFSDFIYRLIGKLNKRS
ncbi:DUF2273 domain-containing protein [Thermoanaerobacterium thermosaccharolyticum]|jgi:uncharacterized membrane protein|uniref:Small integral membrane protein n=3 Tax=Thermoanaerobacterium thermosaccharolyticum TaxID=1517 RepID=D9TQC0_THETC|nr:DUF2273 domain-containing protein [Thermoanaerobacterium thermosaccharolyticum]ADL68821.1 Protein of unknown function DUF2273 [Thermoanaerobacterium thermosaccharolyticum DSM 571]AGB18915.1 Small integral membrane protein (DUF2273) [Thermoanaerobacterium thermosaccharolyticum M0795]AST59139.1 small integral membrane protein [Thermoanaerobacterium thermosaccharolyticum]KAA5807632.1 DUF2273 domain-containing protein [Thermoanaerobacterium thermosaccharolyticum]MBE0067713.1 DUF2273 domain-cont